MEMQPCPVLALLPVPRGPCRATGALGARRICSPSLHGTGGYGPQVSQTLIEERPCSEAARLRAQAFLESEWWSRQQYSGSPSLPICRE